MTDIQILDKIKLMLLEQTTSTEKYVEYTEVLDRCKKLLKDNPASAFDVGEPIIYQNGDSYELGIVKKVCENGDCFVNYNTGDTAARTPKETMHKIKNRYAFHVYRLDTNDKEIR